MDKKKELTNLGSQLRKLATELPADVYPRVNLSEVAAFVEKGHQLLIGSLSWYEQADIVREVRTVLDNIERALELNGRQPGSQVGAICASLERKFYRLLEIPTQTGQGGAALDAPRLRSLYPTARIGRWITALEMAHKFFHLGTDECLEAHSLTGADIYHSACNGHEPPEERATLVFRIPGTGAWTPIPSLLAGPDGRFTGSGNVTLFNARSRIELRIVKKADSRPPISWPDEIAADKAKQQQRKDEMAELIATIEAE